MHNPFKSDGPPILVEVTDGRYDCFSLSPEATYRDKFLMNLLKKKGGINESTPSGQYYFNIENWTLLHGPMLMLTEVPSHIVHY